MTISNHSSNAAGRAGDVRGLRRLSSRGRQAAAVAGVAALGMTLLTACGSSKSNQTSSQTTAAPATSATTAASSGSTTATTAAPGGGPNLMPLTGPGKATGAPIKIGISLVDQGALAAKGMPEGIKGGLYYVNNVLGGIHGHPLDATICHSDGTPAIEVNCANKFVSEGVVAVDDSFDFAFPAEYPILHRAGIPMFGVETADATAGHASDAYFFGPPNEAFAVGPLEAFKDAGYTKLHFSIANVPSAVVYVNQSVNPVAKALGLTMNTTYFDESTVNWTVVANSMLSNNPQMVGEISTTEQDCDALLPAVRNAGFKGPILMAGCSEYVSKYPATATNTYSYGDSWTPLLSGTAPANSKLQIAAYVSAMKAAGVPDVNTYGQLGVMGFAALPDLVYALTPGTYPYTPSAVNTALHNVTNFLSFMGPLDTCDHTQWPGTASCNHSVLMLKVVKGANGQDTWQSVWSEGFHNVDASLLKVKPTD